MLKLVCTPPPVELACRHAAMHKSGVRGAALAVHCRLPQTLRIHRL